jgi:hypothetical protein
MIQNDREWLDLTTRVTMAESKAEEALHHGREARRSASFAYWMALISSVVSLVLLYRYL